MRPKSLADTQQLDFLEFVDNRARFSRRRSGPRNSVIKKPRCRLDRRQKMLSSARKSFPKAPP